MILWCFNVECQRSFKPKMSRGYVLSGLHLGGEVTIGGTCGLAGAVSPNTGIPLIQHAKLTLGGKINLDDNWPLPEINFLYSWTCNIFEADFTYQYKDGSIKILEYGHGGGPDDDFPYQNYPVFFPPIEFDLKQVTDYEQSVIDKLNSPGCGVDYKFKDEITKKLSTPAHHFGGSPFLVDADNSSKICVSCGNNMPLVATIGNQSFSNENGFFGNDYAQIVYFACKICLTVSALNRSS